MVPNKTEEAMIANEKEYQVTQEWVRRFQKTYEELKSLGTPRNPYEAYLMGFMSGQVEGMLEELQEEIREYELRQNLP